MPDPISRYARWVVCGCGLSVVVAATDVRGGDWCLTYERWAENHPPPEGGDCPLEGMCDDPEIRDSWIPDSAGPIKTLRIRFVVFAEDDGSNPTATQAEVDAQLVHLNEDILPSRFQFVAETAFVNSTQFRFYTIDEDAAMKTAYAEAPASKMNVFIVQTGGFSFGTFPWDPIALTALGGIVMDENAFGPGLSILTHEAGHNLGLWHTHHGVSEVSNCSACYERADGVNGDTTGDFAGDTPATPVNFSCGPPGGSDVCSNFPWGETDFTNYMSYTPDVCRSHFTEHQKGRWQCWFNDVLSGWLCDECSVTGACCHETLPATFACTDVLEADCDGTFFGAGTGCDELGAGTDRCDCNGNGVVDTQDILDATSDDCTGNAIPDECEPDCNDNQTADSCDVGDGSSDDCDFDGVPDECQPDEDCNGNEIRDICEIGAGLADDCNDNGVPDACDIDDATSTDCNVNGVPDECESDCNGNGIADDCDIASGHSDDDEGNGVPDECQTVIYVAAGAVGAGDGTSWQDAFDNLQDALSVAITGDRVYVGQGVYRPTDGSSRIASFQLVGGVGLFGGYAGPSAGDPNARAVHVYETILSGDLNGDDAPGFVNRDDNSFNVVSSIGHGASTVLDGFTLRDGNADGLTLPFDAGGGLRIENGSPTVRNCTFIANAAVFGGGMENFAGGNPTVIDTTFRGNRASFRGGGMHNNGSAPTVIGCTFVDNTADNSGGGMRNFGGSTVVVRRSRFIGNTAPFGGGMVNDDSDAHLTNCLFSGNAATADVSGAVHNWQSSLELVNCTISGNTAATAGGGIFQIDGTSPVITNSVFWGNTDQDGHQTSSQVTLTGAVGHQNTTYSCFQGGVPPDAGVGNIADDPLFVDADGVDNDYGTLDDDARLFRDSTSANAGAPEAPAAPSDLDGHRRVLCDRADMGAYEFGAGDFDCDGYVNMNDYQQWPTCVTGPGGESFDVACAAFDFDADDDVDLPDFRGYQQRHRGPCGVVIVDDPTAAVACLGEPVSFHAAADIPGDATLVYQWRLDGTDIPGATDPDLLIASAVESDRGNYRCVVTADCGESAFSGAAELVVTDAATEFVVHPLGGTYCVGDPLFIFVTATNLPTYQWFRDDVALAGATAPFLTIASLTLEDAGAYHAVATNGCNTATSDNAVIEVIDCGDGS